MKANFDAAAANYDASFTNTLIGKIQRDLVYEQLSKVISKCKPKKILEINCGTGQDAIWFAQQNIQVLATDISAKMIDVALQKKALSNLTFKQIDINTINTTPIGIDYDIIFSNFGGLNCLSKEELIVFFKKAGQLIKSNGKLILVIMPKDTLWEKIYFVIKRNFKKVLRRKKHFVMASVNGEAVKTYYYNPKDLETIALPAFTKKLVRPIGFFIPPSYLNSFLKHKKMLTYLLLFLENRIKNISFLSKYADHYFIILEKK